MMGNVAGMREMKTSNFYNVLVLVWEIKAQKGGKRLKLSLCLINEAPHEEDVRGMI
jgi:hypothetical protein